MSQTHIAPWGNINCSTFSIALYNWILHSEATTSYRECEGGRFSFLLYRTSEMSLYKEYITVNVDGGDILYNCARKRFCNVVKEDKLS